MIKRDDFFLNEDFDINNLIENLITDNYKVKHNSQKIIFIKKQNSLARFKIILKNNNHLVLYYQSPIFWKKELLKQKKYFVDKYIHKKDNLYLLKKRSFSSIIFVFILVFIFGYILMHLYLEKKINIFQYYLLSLSPWLFSIPGLIDLIRLKYYCD